MHLEDPTPQHDELPSIDDGTATPFSILPPQKKKRNKKKIFLAALGVLMLVIITVGAGWYIFLKDKSDNNQSTQPVTETVETIEEVTKDEVDAELAKFITPTTGETWLADAKPLPDQGFYKSYDQTMNPPISYYEVGKKGENMILMSVLSELGDDIRLYEKTPAGKVSYIVQPDPDFQYNPEETYVKESLADGIVIDTSTRYDSLTIPKAIKLDTGYYVKKNDYPGLGELIRPGDSNSKVTIVKEYGDSTLTLHEQTNQETNLTSISYRMVTPIGTRVMHDYTPLEKKLQNFTWTVGANNVEDELIAISYGCGGLYTSVTKVEQAKDEDYTVVGKSPTAKDVYHAKDASNTIVTKAYDEFKQFYENDTSSQYAKITKEEFINQHGVLFFKDTTGQWFVYARGQLRPGYGCAKPVVYLYPQHTTDVNVRVGANVKISIPTYDAKNGWSAIAQPNGDIYVDNTKYDYLFWEGPGYGEYPAITSGTVIPTGMALGVIREQLQELGLNVKETEDFMTYWQDKLPEKPYTRLSWLTTEQINTLAPLVISPKPDTIIRVFLDYSGLDAPINLPKQELSATPRNGFTVVEWGGLSPTKLY